MTDNLDGLSDSHIAGKKLFLVQGDKPQLMDWEEYGLRISVPEGSLSSSETTEIAVIALVGGHFKYVLLISLFFYPSLASSFRFPKNTQLVSAVYAISASHLLKSLKLEVQHCINLSDPSLCKYLKFAVAPVHTSSLPYQFRIVEGGEFPANSRYGSIERSKFCLLGIVGEEENGGQSNGQQEQSNGEQEQSSGKQEQSNGESNLEQEQSNMEQEQCNVEQMSTQQERGDSENESVRGKVNSEKEHLHEGGQQQEDQHKSEAG